MPTPYEAEVDAYWSREAARAYAERKAMVWDVYAREGVKPWTQYQVADHDLPFKISQS